MNEIIIDGDIAWYDVSAEYVKNALKGMSGDVTVRVNSPGGYVTEGFAIHNAIKDYSRGAVTVEIDGIAASIASYVVMAGDNIVVRENSVMMIHNAWLPAVGDHRALRKTADVAEGLTSIIAAAYIRRTGRDEKDVRAMMDEETFFYGPEIVDSGFADSTEDDGAEPMNKIEAMALAQQKFAESVRAANNHWKPDVLEAAAAYLEQPKPSKKVEDTGTEGGANASKINALKARMIMRAKDLK